MICCDIWCSCHGVESEREDGTLVQVVCYGTGDEIGEFVIEGGGMEDQLPSFQASVAGGLAGAERL